MGPAAAKVVQPSSVAQPLVVKQSPVAPAAATSVAPAKQSVAPTASMSLDGPKSATAKPGLSVNQPPVVASTRTAERATTALAQPANQSPAIVEPTSFAGFKALLESEVQPPAVVAASAGLAKHGTTAVAQPAKQVPSAPLLAQAPHTLAPAAPQAPIAVPKSFADC